MEDGGYTNSRSNIGDYARRQEEDMMTKILSAMKSVAPDLIYHVGKAKRMRRKIIMKRICPELMPIWANAATIVSPVTNSKQSHTSAYPQVDWGSVNKRFLQNNSVPTLQPNHGCSNDPSFYLDVHESSDYGYHAQSIWFHLANIDVISVPENVFHGYVYEDGVRESERGEGGFCRN